MHDMHRIAAGTILYHGTDNDDFEEAVTPIDGPCWVSSSEAVATYFARRHNWGGTKRIITYILEADIDLVLITNRRQLEDLAEEHGISLASTEDIRNTVTGIPGWIIPNNYPQGDDIFIVRPDDLAYLETAVLG